MKETCKKYNIEITDDIEGVLRMIEKCPWLNGEYLQLQAKGVRREHEKNHLCSMCLLMNISERKNIGTKKEGKKPYKH